MLIDNRIWKTFNGREIPVEQLDRQHLSNIFWYHTICHNTKQDWALEQLKERFNGQPMQYLPHSDHVHELEQLEALGNLKWRDNYANENIQVGEINFGNDCIGIIWRFKS
jgi:hypothetical protein